MIESAHGVDTKTGLPVFSLYGDVRRPTREMMETFDVLLIDLFDVGTRVYTFLYTMAYCLEEAARYGKKIIVLDRPNPIGGLQVEGNILQDNCRSFVGLYPLPMRHGMTFGELALYINKEYAIDADLEIVPMQGWKRNMLFADTGLPFVFPSPNMPHSDTAIVYPGQVIWEGTNISEGRGTTVPFEIFGAPFLDQDRLVDYVLSFGLPGFILRPLVFEPTSNKWQGKACQGFQLHITDPVAYKPYLTSLLLLQGIMTFHKDDFQYKAPPYEYEFQKLPMDLIIGDAEIRQLIEKGENIFDIEKSWQEGLCLFAEIRKKYFLYS